MSIAAVRARLWPSLAVHSVLVACLAILCVLLWMQGVDLGKRKVIAESQLFQIAQRGIINDASYNAYYGQDTSLALHASMTDQQRYEVLVAAAQRLGFYPRIAAYNLVFYTSMSCLGLSLLLLFAKLHRVRST